jgi:Bacterial capsule synthesis protein PGA_cap
MIRSINDSAESLSNSPSVRFKDNYISDFKVLFLGDVTFAENYQAKYESRFENHQARYYNHMILKRYGYDYPFQNFKTFLLQSDLVVANLETPLIDKANTPPPSYSVSSAQRYVKKEGFGLHWSDVRKAPEYLRKYNIRTVSLANNHLLDFGFEGFRQTLEALNRNDISFFGAGYDIKKASKPYIKEIFFGKQILKLLVISALDYRKDYDNVFSFYAKSNRGGVNSLSLKRIIRQIKRFKETNKDVYIVVYPHWGGTRSYGPQTNEQMRLGRNLIDAGADIVIGHGPHSMQNIEKYKGHLIIYTLGNFIFNSRGQYHKYNSLGCGLAAQLVFQKKEHYGTGSRKKILATNGIKKTLRIYPILVDNMITNYQGRFFDENEFRLFHKLAVRRKPGMEHIEKDIKSGFDNNGRYIEFSLDDLLSLN